MRWAREHGFEAVVDARAAYCWPDYQMRRAAGRLVIPDVHGGFEVLDASSEVDRVIGRPFIDIMRLPRLYHGFVHRDLLRRVVSKVGAVLGGTSPDYFSTFVMAAFQPRYCFLDYPVVVSGASGRSNTGRMVISTEALTPHFTEFDAFDWPPELPYFPSATLSAAESVISAAKIVGRADWPSRLNWPYILGAAAQESPAHLPAILRCVPKVADKHAIPLPSLAARTLYYALFSQYRRLRLKASNLLPLPPLPGPRADGLVEAVRLVEQHLVQGPRPPWNPSSS
jgi:hypothetical protein